MYISSDIVVSSEAGEISHVKLIGGVAQVGAKITLFMTIFRQCLTASATTSWRTVLESQYRTVISI